MVILSPAALSSPAKAGDPAFVMREFIAAFDEVGCPAFAGHDNPRYHHIAWPALDNGPHPAIQSLRVWHTVFRMTAQTDNAAITAETFIARWQGQEGGQERANYALFLTELCDTLDLPHPDPADARHERNDYVFERVVTRHRDDGDAIGRIDLYRKGSFVLEAKQSRWKGGKKEIAGQSDLFAAESEAKDRGKPGARRAWDVLMLNAKRQAEAYARALPASHGWPPFILVCDVGHCVEVYADFTGQGKNYTQFPDRQSFRVYLEDLRKDEVRDRLKAIWLDPQTLDPTRTAAKATREIAARLAEVSKALEAKKYPAEEVAQFLMRCLFTMFAASVKLLPEESFRDLLDDCRKDPSKFVPLLGDLWKSMNEGEFAASIRSKVLKFNGNLFADAKVLPLGREEIGELYEAAQKDWHEVEPAIFGTLLEQALDPAERKRLGAHYTPRAYVERLVIATIVEPLREDWRNVQATAEVKRVAGDKNGAVDAVKAFHDKLCETRVLDPACGTGNFLYVSMELMKRLEGEVLEALLDLGGQEAWRGLGGHTVDPHQFLGLEINPRAAAIAELVLWIGYLQWHFRTRGGTPEQPILRKFKNIEVKNAVLMWDGYPHVQFVDGKEAYPNPKRSTWPIAEFIVGNPPFVPNREFRENFDDAYTDALKSAYPEFDQAADFVLFFWIQALRSAEPAKRVGLISTSRLRMQQNNAVFQNALGIHWNIIFAIPDHAWPSAKDSADVRVCFVTVSREIASPKIVYAPDHDTVAGRADPAAQYREVLATSIPPTLDVSFDRRQLRGLLSNKSISHAGVKPYSRSLHIDAKLRNTLFDTLETANKFAPKIYNGVDVGQRLRNLFVLDLHGLTEDEVRKRLPRVFQYLLEQVKPERAAERNPRLRSHYWLFEANREDMRAGLVGLERYLITLENSPQRYFTFLEASILPDQKLRVIISDDLLLFGVLSSKLHELFSRKVGGRAGKANTPVYNTDCFETFPFPSPSEMLKAKIRTAGDELDAFRKQRQKEHPDLTLTPMYSVLEKLKANTPLDEGDETIKDKGLILILKELHERLDRLVFEAYGWSQTLTDEQILEKLVALNHERAAEERRGHVRWLRPDYQIPRFGKKLDKQAAKEEGAQVAADLGLPEPGARKSSFPSDAVAQTAAVFAALAAAGGPTTADAIASGFRRSKNLENTIEEVLASLARLGHVASRDGRTFEIRRVA